MNVMDPSRRVVSTWRRLMVDRTITPSFLTTRR
jgi:hypothetical protein